MSAPAPRWPGLLLAAGLAGAGCERIASAPDPSPAPGAPAAPTAAQPQAPTVDRAQALAALAGDYTVIEPDGQPARWQVSGGELVRRRGERIERGWIEVPEPSRLVVRLGQGRAWFLGFAQDQGQLWLGPGAAGQRQADGSWVVADSGLVVFEPGRGCRWHPPRLSGGYRAAVAVDCTLEPGRLRYTLPRRSRESAPTARAVRLVGAAALGEELQPVQPIATGPAP